MGAVLKLDLQFEMTVWVQSCKAGRRIQTDPQRYSVYSLCNPFVFLCSISLQRQLLVESSEDKNTAFLESQFSDKNRGAITGL